MAKDPKVVSLDIEREAIELVRKERSALQDAVCFVTDRVAFQMRNLIRNLRKNYWGIFDIANDPITNRPKVWVPLTRTLVEGIVKNIDLDTKDISFVSKNPKGYNITTIIRALVHNFLEKDSFGEKLDSMERELAIDGTVVWKFIEGTDRDGKPTVIRRTVDLLNVYIDPTEDNIQDAYRFTERSIMTPEEIANMDGWINNELKDLTGSNIISRIDGQYTSITTGVTAKYRDVWEMWGKIPKRLITGNKEDKEETEGHIVVSGLEVMGPKVHLIKENTKKWKPYEEVRYAKVSNRWYGLGVAERVMMLQIWLNTIINIRINRSYVSQLGLFKIQKGSGITPQMISKLGANGAITVSNMKDIEQIAMQEASQASYTDEQRILDWAQKDTSAYDIAVGERTPANQPATTSVIQNNNARSTFTMIKEGIGSFLERCIDRHMLPIIASTVTVGDLIKLPTAQDAIEPIVDNLVANDAQEALENLRGMGITPTAEQMQAAIERAKAKLMSRDGVFIKLAQKLISEHVNTEIVITNEEMDASVIVQNILGLLPYAPQLQVPLVREAMDLMGLEMPDTSKLIPQPQPQQPPVGADGTGGVMAGLNSPQPQQTRSSTLQGNLTPQA